MDREPFAVTPARVADARIAADARGKERFFRGGGTGPADGIIR
jgi:hypothetical protein